jgi:hypothetical protein
MTKTRVSACAFVVAASLAGCMGTGDVEYAGEVRVTSPELIEISPGVMVIADADEPLFYSRGHYWLHRDGYWFRSADYRGGFARVQYTYVPDEIRVIDRPQAYVHYRSNLGRHHHARTPQVQRRSQPAPQPAQPQQAAPSATQPGVPSQAPIYDHPRPHATDRPPGTHPTQPGVNPAQPTLPPAASDPVQTPNDHRREPPGQRQAPPDIDRTAPGQSGSAPGQSGTAPAQPTRPQDRPPSASTPPQAPGQSGDAPGQANRPQDRGPSAAPAPQGPSSPGATNRPDDRGKSGDAPGQQRRDMDNTGSPNAPTTGESSTPQDRADQATPPGRTRTDDRTKKADQKKDKHEHDR